MCELQHGSEGRLYVRNNTPEFTFFTRGANGFIANHVPLTASTALRTERGLGSVPQLLARY